MRGYTIGFKREESLPLRSEFIVIKDGIKPRCMRVNRRLGVTTYGLSEIQLPPAYLAETVSPCNREVPNSVPRAVVPPQARVGQDLVFTSGYIPAIRGGALPRYHESSSTSILRVDLSSIPRVVLHIESSSRPPPRDHKSSYTSTLRVLHHLDNTVRRPPQYYESSLFDVSRQWLPRTSGSPVRCSGPTEVALIAERRLAGRGKEKNWSIGGQAGQEGSTVKAGRSVQMMATASQFIRDAILLTRAVLPVPKEFLHPHLLPAGTSACKVPMAKQFSPESSFAGTLYSQRAAMLSIEGSAPSRCLL